MAQWHPTKNAHSSPQDITLGSDKKAWWQCTACRCGQVHEWQAHAKFRAKGTGCPVCSGKKPCVCSSLAALHTELLASWDTEGNGDLKPETLTQSSRRKVWWICQKHLAPFTWLATVASRTDKHRPAGCPECAKAAKRGARQRGTGTVVVTSKPLTCSRACVVVLL